MLFVDYVQLIEVQKADGTVYSMTAYIYKYILLFVDFEQLIEVQKAEGI